MCDGLTQQSAAAQGMASYAHEILVRALQLGGLAGIAVAASQVLWSQAASGGAAGMFTTDPAVLTASNAVLLLVYLAMVRAVPVNSSHAPGSTKWLFTWYSLC